MRSILLCAAAAVVLMTFTASADANRGRWQYAVFLQSEAEGDNTLIFQSAEKYVQAQNYPDLYRRLGATEVRADRVRLAHVLDAIGADGWELIAVTQDQTETRKTTRMLFKRPTN